MSQPIGLNTSRIVDIDVVRGVAILSILVLHALVLTPGLNSLPQLLPLINRLSVGVQLFFVLSGYLITQSMERCIAKGEGVKGFLIRRFAKLVPLYLVFLHLQIVLFIGFKAFGSDLPIVRNSLTDETFNFQNYFIHVLFLQGFFPDKLHTFLDGSWSIVIEAYFYLFFAIFGFSKTREVNKALWFYGLTLVVSMVFVVLIGRHFSGYSHYGFLAQFPCFMLGVLVYRLLENLSFQELVTPWRKPLAFIAVIFTIGLIDGKTKPLGDFNIYAICCAVALISAPVIVHYLPILIRKVLSSFGRQSYALFFSHLLLLKTFHMIDLMANLNLSIFVAAVAYLAVSIIGGWILSNSIFDPIDKCFVLKANSWLESRISTSQSRPL